MRTQTVIGVGAAALHGLFAWLVLTGLDAPLLWHDEGDTAMFGRRILEYGYPKVHGPRNVVYGVEHPLKLGSRLESDAYVGSPWAQYYFAAPAVAWSDRAEDLGARTWRVRLPFALAGCLGVLLLWAAGASLLPGEAGSRWLYALGAGVLLCVSVSLQLHLREARYYPLAVLGLGVVAYLLVRRHVRRDLAALPYTVGLSVVLWVLFNLFYPCFFAIVGTAAGVLAWQALRSTAPGGVRVRELMREAAPFAVACVAALPLVFFYQIPAQGLAFLARHAGDGNFANRLGDAAYYLLRFEFAAPALVGGLAVALASLRAGPAVARVRPALRACAVLIAFSLVWVALVARTPFFFERYCVALSPLLIGVCMLELAVLKVLLRGASRLLASVGMVVTALALVAAIGVRGPELRGRLIELSVPYRGPLDYVIPYLEARYPEPEQLVIATNYEDPSYMFYLGSSTIMGFYTPHRMQEFQRKPDVIIVRPWAGRERLMLKSMSKRARYVGHVFPVANVRVNNIPSLSTRNKGALVHRFVSPQPGRYGEPLLILERVPSE